MSHFRNADSHIQTGWTYHCTCRQINKVVLTQREDHRLWAWQSASFPGTKSTFAIDRS